MIALPAGLERQIGAALRTRDEVSVVTAPRAALITSSTVEPLEVTAVAGSEIDGALRTAPTNAQLWLVRAILDDATLAMLEDAGIGYLDAAGRSWLPGLARTAVARAARTPRRGMRAAALRMAQLLADHPSAAVTAATLAERADSTPLTAKRLLSELEAIGLVARSGAGRNLKRTVDDIVGLRRWLLENGAHGTPERLACFVPDLAALSTSEGVVLTGAAAAERVGLGVLTGVERPMYRVDTRKRPLEDVPAALGGIRVASGANALLLADPERLASLDAGIADDGTRLAPPSRIMLDLTFEPRGRAAAELFLDLWGAQAEL